MKQIKFYYLKVKVARIKSRKNKERIKNVRKIFQLVRDAF